MAVIYHSNYGHTKRVAEAIVMGARQQLPEAQVKAVDVNDVDWDFLDQADLLVFGSAVYMGSVTSGFKTFMDATSKRWYHGKWQDKWAAGFANSGGLSGDKLAVLQQVCLYAMQHGMNWIGLPLMPTGHEAHDLNRLSSFLGLMTQSLDGPPDVTRGAGGGVGRRTGRGTPQRGARGPRLRADGEHLLHMPHEAVLHRLPRRP